jgi:heat shock protein HslJ
MKQQLMLIAAANLLLAGCQTMPEPASTPPPSQASYKAHGTEPFWSLKIEGGNMVFDHSGELAAKAKSFDARPSFNGWRYVSKEITADVTFTPCSDGMSDWTYKDTVTVMVGDQEYKGCGGGITAPESMDGIGWRVVSINSAKIPVEREAMINFDANRMSGTVGCNRLGTEYSYKDKKLSFGPVMSTKMACPDPIGAQEYAFISLLGSAFSTEFPGDGSMVLTGKDGAKVVLEQII